MIFVQHDRDRSGALDFQELNRAIHDVFSQMGVCPPPEHLVAEYLWEYDYTGTGSLNQKEFKHLIKDICKVSKNKKKDKNKKKKKNKYKDYSFSSFGSFGSFD